jgi:hypothetical protein
MTDATMAAFVETKEYRRFREFCDACRRYRYIGLCYGPPGVGKTLSARRYADWGRVAKADPNTDFGVFRTDEVPGKGCVFYTATVVNSPRQVEGDIDRLRGKMHALVRQAIRSEVGPVIAAARQDLEQAREELFVDHDWLTGKPEQLSRAEGVVSEAFLGQADRDRAVVDPTELVLVDEVDRLKMAALEQFRSIFDRGGIGLVLIGMPGLERRLALFADRVRSRVPAAGCGGSPLLVVWLASGGCGAARGSAGRRRGCGGDHSRDWR